MPRLVQPAKAASIHTPLLHCAYIKMSQPRIVLPITTIQPDFESILTDVKDGIVPEDTFWVSCYKTGEQSVHGKAHLTLNERNRDVVDYIGQGGIEFNGHEAKVSICLLAVSLT